MPEIFVFISCTSQCYFLKVSDMNTLSSFLDKLYFWKLLQPVEYLEVAEKAASFIKVKLYDASSKRLYHSYRNGPSKAPGFLDDYAFLINGLLDLYEFGGKIEWLLWAVQLQVTQAT